MIIAIVWIVAVAFVEMIVPEWLAVILAIANIFVPDMVPMLDEVVGIAIVIKRLIDWTMIFNEN